MENNKINRIKDFQEKVDLTIGKGKIEILDFDEKGKVIAKCLKHNEIFKQTKIRILQGRSCYKCSYEHKYKKEWTDDTLEERIRKIHGDDYEFLEYDEKTRKFRLFCHVKDKDGNEHGEFIISRGHCLGGQGCPKCRYIKSAKSKTNSLERLKNDIEKKGDKDIEYDFSTYVSYSKPMRMICHKKDKDGNEHGEFWQTLNNHFHKTCPQGCPKCGRESTIDSKRYNTESFKELVNKIHINKDGSPLFDLSLVNYIDSKTKVDIICKKHGVFKIAPYNLLQGQGCPICKQSKLEAICRRYFLKNGIEFESEKTFDWLIYKRNMKIDFYLPHYNVAIECQGLQHFNAEGWCAEDSFAQIIERDKLKKQLCEEHGIKMFYFSNLGIEYPYQVYENLDEMLNIIKNNIKE